MARNSLNMASLGLLNSGSGQTIIISPFIKTNVAGILQAGVNGTILRSSVNKPLAASINGNIIKSKVQNIIKVFI